MELIECYQPEFVTRFIAAATPCTCPSCQLATDAWPHVSVAMKNQQRESLDIACESAAKAILLDPEAFILQTSRIEVQGEESLSPWDEMLNQQCINLAVHPAMPLEVCLYAIGVLLSKAQQYLAQGETNPELLQSMSEQLALLAEQGLLEEQFHALPAVAQNRLAALQALGKARLNINLPMVEKMSVMLKLSELSIMQPARLEERLVELESNECALALFIEQPHILHNLLIYKLYHDIFPGVNCTNYGEAFLTLATTFFRIKMLCAIGAGERGTLSENGVLGFISALSAWENKHPRATAEGATADHSLLCGLSLL